MCRLYTYLCHRFGPRGMTLSALAHLRAKQGKPWWRNRIDGFFLLFFGQHQHSQASFQRGRAQPKRG